MAEILGNESLLSGIRRIVRGGQVSHSYILNGDEGTGKRMIADRFAQMLQCSGEDRPCGRCLSCLQALSGNHPDIIYVGHEKPNLISVDDIRSGIGQTMQVRPYESPYKIYIVDEAEKMNVQAQNALLKTIEEPPEYGVLLFLTTNADGFLPTILSRCVRLDVKPLTDAQVGSILRERGVPASEAVRIARLSGGSAGKALEMSGSETFRAMSDAVFGILRQADRLGMREIHSFLSEMGKLKDETDKALSLIELWFRDVLVLKASKDSSLLMFDEELPVMSRLSAVLGYADIDRIFQAVQETRGRLTANVNYELSLELLLLTVRDLVKRQTI